jgi:hypothetical protein
LKAGSNVTTEIESAAASGKKQKKHRKNNRAGPMPPEPAMMLSRAHNLPSFRRCLFKR